MACKKVYNFTCLTFSDFCSRSRVTLGLSMAGLTAVGREKSEQKSIKIVIKYFVSSLHSDTVIGIAVRALGIVRTSDKIENDRSLSVLFKNNQQTGIPITSNKNNSFKILASCWPSDSLLLRSQVSIVISQVIS